VIFFDPASTPVNYQPGHGRRIIFQIRLVLLRPAFGRMIEKDWCFYPTQYGEKTLVETRHAVSLLKKAVPRYFPDP